MNLKSMCLGDGDDRTGQEHNHKRQKQQVSKPIKKMMHIINSLA